MKIRQKLRGNFGKFKEIHEFLLIFAATTQVRFAHTDIQTPDFSYYRRDSTKRPGSKAQTAEERKAFTYLLVGGEF